MSTLEQQINWLSNHITYLIIIQELYKNRRIQFEKTAVSDFNNQIENHKQCLESLVILLERDLECENCVNAYFDKLENLNL